MAAAAPTPTNANAPAASEIFVVRFIGTPQVHIFGLARGSFSLCDGVETRQVHDFRRKKIGAAWIDPGGALGFCQTDRSEPSEAGDLRLLAGDEFQQRRLALFGRRNAALDGGNDVARLLDALAMAAQRLREGRIVAGNVG